jgi:hypothetical protein
MTNLFGNKNVIVPSNNPEPVQPDKKTKDVTVLFIDSGGLFIDFAKQATPQFKDAYYWTPCLEADFPDIKRALLGYGLEDEGLHRIIDMWSPKEDNGYSFDDVDLFCFLDVAFGGLQRHLISIGKVVWGNRYTANLENYRLQTKVLMKEAKMPVNNTFSVVGMKKLKEFLKGKSHLFIKISLWRNGFETFEYIDEKQSAPRLAEIDYTMGEAAELVEFIIETPIKSECESGMDTYNIDGQYPKHINWGYEIKDLAFISFLSDKLPKPLQYIADKSAVWFKEFGLRGNVSNEVRIEEKTKKPYLTDPTQRIALPPNQIQSRQITNWGDIMWYGANGILKETEFKFKYGALIMIYCSWAINHWEEIEFDEEIKDNISLNKYCKINKNYYVIPDAMQSDAIGCLVALGNSVDECIKKLEKMADKVRGYKLEVKTDQLDKLKEVIENGTKSGLKFS